MLLFQRRLHAGILSGATTLTFRTWERCRVKVGGRYRCHPLGVLLVHDVSRVQVGAIALEDARAAGFATAQELRAFLAERGSDEHDIVWRVRFEYVGDGDRAPNALHSDLTAEDIADIRAKLAVLDARAPRPFTAETLAIIEQHPHIAASKLAAKLGRDTPSFKRDVVRLKKLGLTQSFEVGYALTPRGRAFLVAR